MQLFFQHLALLQTGAVARHHPCPAGTVQHRTFGGVARGKTHEQITGKKDDQQRDQAEQQPFAEILPEPVIHVFFLFLLIFYKLNLNFFKNSAYLGIFKHEGKKTCYFVRCRSSVG